MGLQHFSPDVHHNRGGGGTLRGRWRTRKAGLRAPHLLEIAPRYDFLNHVLSANIDKGWRRRAIAALQWERDPHGTYVDLCAGTLDIGAAIAREPSFAGQEIGADFAEPMLRAGAAKSRTLAVLDCSTPRAAAVRVPYHFYFHRVLPVIGRLVSGHKTAYQYLPGSVDNFPDGDSLARRMRDAGIASVRWEPLTFGISALHYGERAA